MLGSSGRRVRLECAVVEPGLDDRLVEVVVVAGERAGGVPVVARAVRVDKRTFPSGRRLDDAGWCSDLERRAYIRFDVTCVAGDGARRVRVAGRRQVGPDRAVAEVSIAPVPAGGASG